MKAKHCSPIGIDLGSKYSGVIHSHIPMGGDYLEGHHTSQVIIDDKKKNMVNANSENLQTSEKRNKMVPAIKNSLFQPLKTSTNEYQLSFNFARYF